MKNISLQTILPSAICLAVCLAPLSLAGCAEERKAPEDMTWEDVQTEWEDLQENGRDARVIDSRTRSEGEEDAVAGT